MLCRDFEWIPIKIGFFMNFKSYSKIRPKTLYYSTVSLARVYSTASLAEMAEENSPFL